MELIDKNKLDSFKYRSASERMDLPVDYMVGWNDAVDGIMCNAPAVDAEPVRHGKWTVTPVYIKCSECGESFMLIPQNYCPNCGAKMDERA